ncbi:MAG: ornithine carbamoyltransferase, partial [Armatimonadota bacterium]
KPSLRTKVSFQVAMTRLGGNGLYLGRDEVGLGKREAVRDVARTLSRMVDALIVRTFDHAVLEELAHWADVPVVNALDDREHPCQALADFYTVLEHRGGTEGQKMVFVGDGNNVAISLMLMAPLLGVHFTLACPAGYEPPAETVSAARRLAEDHGTVFEMVHDPLAAASQADVLYTDVWVSMGQEEETARRRADFAGYRIDERLIGRAKEDVLILHCLPAHRGDEIDDESIEGPHARVFDQAENRLHLQQALLAAVL